MVQKTKGKIMSEENVTVEEVKSVPKTAYDEMFQDLSKAKAKARELEEKTKLYEQEREEIKLRSLKEKEDFKSIAERETERRKALEQKLDETTKATQKFFKRTAIQAEALKAGLYKDAIKDLELLNMDDVEIETTSTGSFNVLGVDKFIERQKSERHYWFNDKSAPNIQTKDPSVTASGSSGDMSLKDILKLDADGKTAEYQAAIKAYQKKKYKK